MRSHCFNFYPYIDDSQFRNICIFSSLLPLALQTWKCKCQEVNIFGTELLFLSPSIPPTLITLGSVITAHVITNQLTDACKPSLLLHPNSSNSCGFFQPTYYYFCILFPPLPAGCYCPNSECHCRSPGLLKASAHWSP